MFDNLKVLGWMLILLVTSQGMKPLNFEFFAGVWTVTQLAVCAKGKKITLSVQEIRDWG